MIASNETELVIRNHSLNNNSRYPTVFPLRAIVAGFPGVGKSTAAKMYPELIIDMESSTYHWISGTDGSKTCNPEWPKNYVDAILDRVYRTYSDTDHAVYVCISTHSEVLKELEKLSIYYLAVLPKSKDLYIQRYRDRGSDEAFINLLDAKFDEFIKDVENSSAFGIYYTNGYLVNIFVPEKDE